MGEKRAASRTMYSHIPYHRRKEGGGEREGARPFINPFLRKPGKGEKGKRGKDSIKASSYF